MSFVDDFFGLRDAVRTLVVSPYTRDDETGRHRFDEFVSLSEAADLDPVGVAALPVREPHPGTYFRSGHVNQLREHVETLAADIVAIDVELSPAQQRELEKRLGAGVLDRTAIILTIFGRRGRTRAGKLQVELAQTEWLLPRLVGLWQHLDREKGGIGMRGAGEKQIEMDRRLLKRRMAQIRRELRDVERTRELHRAKRRRGDLLNVAAVGYTNVGKSTLMKALAGGSVFVRDMPFATLDPLTRRITLPDGLRFLLTDTVGFVQDLPHGLVEAFQSTLEEVLEADLLLHVVDVSAPDPLEQVRTTIEVLAELGANEIPVLYILNKLDLARDPDEAVRALADLQPQVRTSLIHHEGLPDILAWIGEYARRHTWSVRIRLPLDRPELIELAERTALGPGRWTSGNVEYDVSPDSELAKAWAVEAGEGTAAPCETPPDSVA